ncbi:MAG: phosphatidylserine decarboxylase family protein [Bacteroidales bacterium]|nr:phosphatidylserine decarboxylase family protein [Bacteroidales bacterium]
MKLHKEGKNIIFIAFLILAPLTSLLIYWGPDLLLYQIPISLLALTYYFLIIRFFRVPKRNFVIKDGLVLSPADGEVVVVEEVFEDEYLKEKCLQVSVFMSPYNIHINWFPFSGKVKYLKYHPGKHLVAWHPKSSKLNERTSVCLETEDHKLVMIRQIAGAVARRIVCYAKIGETVKQNDELGFIKFGSRVDLFLPLSAKPQVKLKDKVIGGISVIAEF